MRRNRKVTARGNPRRALLVLCALLASSRAAAQVEGEVGTVYKVGGVGEFDNFGYPLALIDDLDADGIPEFAGGTNHYPLQTDERTGYVGLVNGRQGRMERRLEGERGDATYGTSLAVVGDVDGDGWRDLVIGNRRGRVEIRSSVTEESLVVTGIDTAELSPLIALLAPGDLDGDAIPDFVVLQSGHATPEREDLGQVVAYSGRTGRVLWSREGSWSGAHLGSSGLDVEDRDGDGVREILVAGRVPAAEPRTTLSILSGASGEILAPFGPPEGSPGTIAVGEITHIGDINRDGVSDFAVPYFGDENPFSRGKGIYVAYSGISHAELLRLEGIDRESKERQYAGDFFGIISGPVGDVDGDGGPDIALSAFRFGNRVDGPLPWTYLAVVSGQTGLRLESILWPKAEGLTFWAVQPLGDVDGDGAKEFLASIPSDFASSDHRTGSGVVRAISYSADRLSFLRGDVDLDGRVTLSDAIRILNWVFAGEAAHPCLEAANVNNSSEVDVGDALTLFFYLFMAGPAPLPPFPECGRLGGLAAIPERACRNSTCAP